MAEADPRSSNYNTNYDFEKLQCDFCREAFSVEKPAKLLPCLHSACDECLTELIEADQTKSEEEKDPTKKDLPGEEIQGEMNTCVNLAKCPSVFVHGNAQLHLYIEFTELHWIFC